MRGSAYPACDEKITHKGNKIKTGIKLKIQKKSNPHRDQKSSR
jgi:hypothetical protein